ncbi:MAG: putative rane-bound dehydrogenase domain protein, partial [Planctomycetaceae bacterium]|nr:putative rane-bound dehydrogenase domain protein [Planctomycetaceae bacterium]
MSYRFTPLLLSLVLGIALSQCSALAEDFQVHRFERQQLTDVYFSEGANFGDFNQDGKPDVVHGPYWWEGPEFKTRREIYPPKPQNRDGYSTNFFTWVHDFTGDGWNDLVSVGLPGSAAVLYVNPGAGKVLDATNHWQTHKVFDGVGNESPLFLNLVGDAAPELVCNHAGKFGYAVPNGEKQWTWHAISEAVGEYPFGHGLGVGDVNGDGRQDVIWKAGWYEQPKSIEGDPLWTFHKYQFAGPGGADMYAYDVDGDGDNDVITSLAAHAFGLAWFEQVKEGDEITFKKHVILGDKAEDNPYGVVFTELHAVALHDMDGDGLKDIVTGKTYWSHHRGAPQWDAGAVVYWFKLVRGKDGVDWVPHRADDEAGIGRQLSVGDLDGDKLPDIVVGGMKGGHILHHKIVKVSEQEFKAAQPKKLVAMAEGLSPEAAAAAMTVPEGFHVKLAAGEPLVHQPIAFTTDARGRLWVAEAYTYPNRAKHGQGKDKIVILEDTDGDGKFENRKVFIEGLNLISGLEVGFGGVWVGAAPYLMFIPDQNGDDIPDMPAGKPDISMQFPKDVPGGATVLLDGFGWQDTHETLNSFIWGPDGWLYGCHGVFTHSKVGKPGTPEAGRQGLNAGVWRYHPTRHQFEVFSHGTSNPWGVDFNDQGQAFITACVIPHLWHMIQGGRYSRQGGQHFNQYTFDDIQTIADHLHYVGNIRDHAWWGHEPNSPTNTLAAGGGHAHAGALVYLGDNWPAKYRNQIFMHNVHGNRINECLLERRGSGYVGHRAPDLMIANDRWFRGINLKCGPDGSVYLIDWYDKNACHRTNPEIWDRTNGRVYNISYGKPKPVKVDLTTLPDAELVKLQLHANDWYVRTARRILAERASAGKLEAQTDVQLAAMAQSETDPKHRLRAVWALHSIGKLDASRWQIAAGDSDEYLRAWAIQLACETGTPSDVLLTRFNSQALVETSAVVRLYLASALQRIPVKQRWDLATSLLSRAEDAADHNLPLVLWYGVEPLVASDSAKAVALAKAAKLEKVSRLIVRRAASSNETANSVVEWLASADSLPIQQMLLDEIRLALEGRANIPQPAAWGPAYDKLLQNASPEIRERADQIAVAFGDKRILPRMRDVLADPKAPVEQRQRALELLVKGRDAEAGPAFRVALNEMALRSPAIRALAAFDDAATSPAILALYTKLSEAEKRDAINTLVARPASASQLFDAIEKGEVPRTDVHAYHVQQLLGFKDPVLAKRITSVWGEIRATAKDKLELIAKQKAVLTSARLKSAELSNGRRLFVKTCAACHILFGEGGKIGPDITGSNRANLDYVLENILDPSAIVGKDYRMTVIVTKDGRTVSGLIQKETDSAVTLRTINDTIVVAKSDIEERKLSELSLMPEGQLNQLTPDEQRDLIAYLGTPTQVSLRGPKAPIDSKTGKVKDALEGESLKIVGKTGGNAVSQPMSGFSADRWSGNDQLWWTGGGPGARLELELPVATDGTYQIEVALTMARDYGIVQI